MSHYQIRFTREVLEELSGFRQIGNQPERGGILLGMMFEGGLVQVTDISKPGKADRFGRYFFVRNRKRAQQIVNDAWAQSGGTKIYLGEWHTHPEPNPSPSGRDKAMIRNMRCQSKMHIDFLLLYIVGQQTEWIGIESIAGLTQVQSLQG